MSDLLVDASWQKRLAPEFAQPYMAQLLDFVARERSRGVSVYPPAEQVLAALRWTPYDQVKVVIIGQDPYHGPGQANGLAFGVAKGVAIPPSLRNIYQELQRDVGIPIPKHGCLQAWARQGVLLLNTTLTVEDGQPRSHDKQGWERFTDAVVAQLGLHPSPLVFLLWGKAAQLKVAGMRKDPHHLILTAPHPSPLSAYQGFVGCRHFSQANAFLQEHGISPIDWAILD